MKDFKGRIGVVTGAGSGIGRELARQLAAEGCHLALCDIMVENLEETRKSCQELAPPGTLISAHRCDVADESQVIAFRDAVKREHHTGQINLLFNNAGIGGGGSFICDERASWDRAFGICWFGVYYNTRAFLPLLLAATEGHIVNISSVNGFWACLGPVSPHTAYSSAKFAVKGFTEALQVDLRLNAPHVKASVVMPGHIGTSISINSTILLGGHLPTEMTAEDIANTRNRLARAGLPTDGIDDDQLKALIQQRMEDFRDKAPTSAAQAATVILDGVRNQQWRILIGDDARILDRLVRESPETAYEASFMERLLAEGTWSLG